MSCSSSRRLPRDLKPLLNDRAAIRKALAEKSLAEFIRILWPAIDPAAYVHGWHIDAICAHLEAVNRGEIRKLLINMPPRHMKSLAVAVAWPAWT